MLPTGINVAPAPKTVKPLALPKRSNNYGNNLSPREIQIVDLLLTGQDCKAVGAALCISYKTVKFHSTKIYRKLKVKGQIELLSKKLAEKEKQLAELKGQVGTWK